MSDPQCEGVVLEGTTNCFSSLFLSPPDLIKLNSNLKVFKITKLATQEQQLKITEEIKSISPPIIFLIYPHLASLKILESLFHHYQGKLPKVVIYTDESFLYQTTLWSQFSGVLTYQELLFLVPHPHLKNTLEKLFIPSELMVEVLPWALQKPLPQWQSKEKVVTYWAMHEGMNWEDYFQCPEIQSSSLEIYGPTEVERHLDAGETPLCNLSYFHLQQVLKRHPQCSYRGPQSEVDFVGTLKNAKMYVDFSRYPYPLPPITLIPYLMGVPSKYAPWGFNLFKGDEYSAEQRQQNFSIECIQHKLKLFLQRPWARFAHFTELFYRLANSTHRTPTRLWHTTEEVWMYKKEIFDFYPHLKEEGR